VKPVEDSLNVYGADQGYTSYLRVANVGEAWIRPNFSVTPLAKSIRIHHESNEVFHQNHEWDTGDRGQPFRRGREDQYPLTSYLRPEQIEYVDRQYAKDYFAAPADKSAYLGAMKLPSSVTTGELDYQFEMSYQLWEFQKTGSLPLQIGASVIANGSEFTLVQVDLDQLLNSGRGKVWLRQRASQVPMMAEFESQNQSMAYVINSDTSAVTSIDFSRFTKVYNTGTLAPLNTSIIQLDIYLDNNVPYDERVVPLDLKIDLYEWVYLGVEDLGPIEIHKSMADLFKRKSKAAKATRTRTYPVLHSSQYWK
jgi:hypothetical protein